MRIREDNNFLEGAIRKEIPVKLPDCDPLTGKAPSPNYFRLIITQAGILFCNLNVKFDTSIESFL